MKSSIRHGKQLVIETIGLQTPRGRLLFFGLVTAFVFFGPYAGWLNISLWSHLGIPSPSIGLTRAYWLLLHGDPIGAWQRNALIYIVLAVGLPLLLKDIYKLWYNLKILRARSSVEEPSAKRV